MYRYGQQSCTTLNFIMERKLFIEIYDTMYIPQNKTKINNKIKHYLTRYVKARYHRSSKYLLVKKYLTPLYLAEKVFQD